MLVALNKHRPHAELGDLQRKKGPFESGEAVVGGHRRLDVEGLGIQIGTDDVDAVEAGFSPDLLLVAGLFQPLVGDGEVEVFLDPVAMSLAGGVFRVRSRCSGLRLCLRVCI